MKFISSLIATAVISQTALATPSVLIKTRFKNAASGEIVRNEKVVELPKVDYYSSKEIVYTDKGMLKTKFLIDLATTIKSKLKAVEKACTVTKPTPRPIPRPLPHPRHPLPPIDKKCEHSVKLLAHALLKDIDQLQSRVEKNIDILGDEKILEMLDLSRKLAKNIKELKKPVLRPLPRPIPGPGPVPRPMPLPEMRGFGGGGLNITAGGAQDIDSFRKIVNADRVPNSSSLPIEGFLSEFDLSSPSFSCDQLICFNTSSLVDPKEKKLFVQLHMSSNVKAESFQRKPLNLSVVLDISGSMNANDDTGKSRLEWAKDSLEHILGRLNSNDYISLVVFDTESEIVVPTTKVTDKHSLMEKIDSLKTKGSTNLEAGLRDGYELVSDNLQIDGYENRVILLTDANLNTGTVEDSQLLRMVSDYAAEGIGLSAVGIGVNFNQEFIHKITMSRGGNYSFVQSGKGLLKLIKNFDFYVTPVAYDFKALVDLKDLDAKLVNTFGLPKLEDELTKTQIDIRTLFFSSGGGALVLEYDLK